MLRNFFLFELRSYRRKGLIYLTFILNFLLLFFATINEDFTIGFGGSGLYVNSPFAISAAIMTTSFFMGLFIATSIGNTAALRDRMAKFDAILFSYPIHRFGFYWGRLLAGWVLTCIPLLGGLLGIALGTLMPFAPMEDIGPSSLLGYVQAFILFLVPNSFILICLIYSLAMRYGKTSAGFIGTALLLVAYIITGNMIFNMDTGNWVVFLDPLGFNATLYITKYWTVFEQNTQHFFSNSSFLINRGAWVIFSFGLAYWHYRRFSFEVVHKKAKNAELKNGLAKKHIHLPAILPSFKFQKSLRTTFSQFISMVKMDLKTVLKSPTFWILTLLGLTTGLNALGQADGWYNNGSYPATYIMIEAVRSGMHLFTWSIAIFYTGFLIWRERDVNMATITDAMPITNLGRVSAKLVAILSIIFIFQLITMILGMLTQLAKGQASIDFGQYMIELLGIDMITLGFAVVLSALLHTLIHNKYLGYGATLGALLMIQFGLPKMGFDAHWFLFGQFPDYLYSDMNGYGPYANMLGTFAFYWVVLSVILWAVASRMWVRGIPDSIKKRIQGAWSGYSLPSQITLCLLIVGFLITGGFIFYQTEIVHERLSEQETLQRAADYELAYKKFQDINHPRVVETDFEIHLYPESQSSEATVHLVAVNTGATFIDTVHFTLPSTIQSELYIPNARLTLNDERLGFQSFHLESPLAPGDSLFYSVNSHFATDGIRDGGDFTEISANGTFLVNLDLVPIHGYLPSKEIQNPENRTKVGLSSQSNRPNPNEATQEDLRNHYVMPNADRVGFTATISTVEDQIAIAPGTLVKQWKEDGRAYFQYTLETPTLNFFNFVSARYTVAREQWEPAGQEAVQLEVYHHDSHGYNVPHMLKSMAAALDYYTEHFGPYPHRQARIIEFPRYGDFAQAFPGTMPYSESVGFITDMRDSTAIDQVFLVVAHELAHQWWAHQVIGADVAGATFMSETFAQYSALMVMEKAYGKERMRQFLAYERDKYLKGRGRDPQPERPIVYSQNQSYIHYNKGSILMYALKDYIGEDSVNLALKRYLNKYRDGTGGYSTSLDAMAEIRAVTPDSLHPLLEEMFERITLYNLATTEATAVENGNGTYKVTLAIDAQKVYADGQGEETEQTMADWVAVGIYPEATTDRPYPEPLRLEYVKLHGDTVLSYEVHERPYEAGIDPHHILIDRVPDDNLKKISLEN